MSKNLFLKIKVTNLGSRQEYIHSNVPIDHVEMLRLNPNLKVEVIGRSRNGNRRDNSGENVAR